MSSGRRPAESRPSVVTGGIPFQKVDSIGPRRFAGNAPEMTQPEDDMSTLAPTDTGKPRSPYSIEVLHKAFDIIDVFGHEHPSLTLKHIVAPKGLPKTTVFRILSTLVERLYCEFDLKSETLPPRLRAFTQGFGQRLRIQKHTYVVLADEDFVSARVESSSTMTVDKFVDVAIIDSIYFDASYYLAPDGKAGRDVYGVLRDAIASTGKMALARVVIARRDRAMGIIPMGPGLVAHTLHEERDLNNASDVFDDLPTGKSDPEMVKLATQLIERQTGKYDPSDVEDRYEARLRVRPKSSHGFAKPSEHQPNGREAKERQRGPVEVLEILGQPPTPSKPAKAAFDDPSFR
jgi:Ku protein